MFRKTLATISLLLALTVSSDATPLIIPNTFYPSTPAQSAQVNADFTAVASVVNGNIDNTNIGPAGIYASNVDPLTAAEATFGGTQTYTFPAAVVTGGSVSAGGPITTTSSLTATTGPITTNGALDFGNGASWFENGTSVAFTTGPVHTGGTYIANGANNAVNQTWPDAGGITLNRGPLIVTSLTSGLCVQTTTGGQLTTSSAACNAGSATKYSVVAAFSAPCAANTGCTSYSTTGMPGGSPSSTGNCSAMEVGSIYPGASAAVAYSTTYVLEVQNTSASAIPSGANIAYNVTCQ